MDIKSLTDEELNELQQRIQVEVDNRREVAAAPLLIQQTAIRAIANGASASILQEALTAVIDTQAATPTDEPPTPEEGDAPPEDETSPNEDISPNEEETPPEEEIPPVEEGEPEPETPGESEG